MKTLAKNWFLIGLALVLASGMLAHERLHGLVEFPFIQTTIVFVVMLMMAAPIPMILVRQCLARPWPGLLASFINMGFLPLLAFAVAPMLSTQLAGGLIVAAAIPSTLASAAVMTRRAGGDDSVAILGTLITNLSCAIVTPLWLIWLLGKSTNIEAWPLATNLMLLVVVPIVVAQLMRLSSNFARAADRNKATLSTLCQIGILLMVLLGAIQMGEKIAGSSSADTNLASILLVLLASTATHLIALAVGWYLAAATHIARPQQIAVAFSGSQKTLMIGLKLAIDCGVSILPMVIFHVSQLVVDSMIAERWRKQEQAGKSPEKLPPESPAKVD